MAKKNVKTQATEMEAQVQETEKVITSEMMDKIKSLIFSADPANIRIGLNIMEANKNELTPENVAELFSMVFVEGGSYKMGATPEQGSNCESDEYPVHTETVGDLFCCKYPCWQALWEAITFENPSFNQQSGLHPVEQVSWDEIHTKFLDWMNKHIAPEGYKFILPTEAEWEYVARGGKKTKGYKYAGSNNLDEVSWYSGNSDGHSHPVGEKKPNELGVYDMTSNVLNWCENWYEPYKSDEEIAAEKKSKK